MAGATRISQASESALITQEPSFIWKSTQVAHTTLISVEPPPTFVRVLTTLETALIEQTAPGKDPALGLGAMHQVLISEDRITGATSVKHASLIQEQAPYFPAQVTQVRQRALISVEPPLNGIPVVQVTHKALVQVDAPITGSVISQAVHTAIVQLEAPSKAPQVPSVYQMALFVDSTTASKIRSPGTTHVALIEEEAASPNTDRSRSVVSSVVKSVTMPSFASIRSNAIVPTVVMSTVKAKTFTTVQSNALVIQDTLLTAKATHPINPSSVMSNVVVPTVVLEAARVKNTTNPGLVQSMSNVATIVVELVKPVIKVQPSSVQSQTVVPQLVAQVANVKSFGSATVASMCEVAQSTKQVVVATMYPESAISDAQVKKVTRSISRVAQYPNLDDLRSMVLINQVGNSIAFTDDSYVQPELIQATTMIPAAAVLTSRPRTVRDPADEHSASMVREAVEMVSVSTVPKDPTQMATDTKFVWQVTDLLAIRAMYFNPLAPESARRDSYSTYYTVLDT